MGFDASKTKLQLKGAIQRIQILSKKKTAVSAASKAEISQLLLQKKDDKARIKVEHIIRDDLLVEALELLEIYCETLLARFSTLEQMRHCDPGISEAVNTIIYASPRVGVDELINVRNQLIMKYGKEFADASMENRNNCVNDRIIVKLQTKTPEQLLVNQYLKTIADSYKVNWDYERPIEELPPAPPPLNYGAELGAQYQPSAPPANQFYPSAPQSFNAGPPDHTNGGVKVLPTGTPSDVNLGSPVSAPSAPPPADSMSDFDAMQKRFQDLKSKNTVALLSGVFGITSEEKRLRRQRAEAADKQLKFAPVHDIPTLVSQKGLTLLFFGAHWCKYTQLFTPKFLAGVNQLDRLGYNEKNMPWLAIRKVECGEQELEKECVETYKTEGYPTIWLYSDGQPIEEYPDADETGPFVEYMKRVADYYAETHKSSVVGEPHQPLQQLGPQQPPQTVKAVVSEEHIKAEDTATIASTASSSFSLSFGLLVIVALFVIYGLVKMSSRNSPNGPRYNKIAA